MTEEDVAAALAQFYATLIPAIVEAARQDALGATQRDEDDPEADPAPPVAPQGEQRSADPVYVTSPDAGPRGCLRAHAIPVSRAFGGPVNDPR